MNVISNRFADELGDDKAMRDAFRAAQTRTKIANQIRAIRSQRGWSQGEFAKLLGKPQSNVSRLENREYGNFTLATLLELASAFDVGILVEFVPYAEFLTRTRDLKPESLEVAPFNRAALDSLCSTAEQADTSADVGPALRHFLEGILLGQKTEQISVQGAAVRPTQQTAEAAPSQEMRVADIPFGRTVQVSQLRPTP